MAAPWSQEGVRREPVVQLITPAKCLSSGSCSTAAIFENFVIFSNVRIYPWPGKGGKTIDFKHISAGSGHCK